MRNYELAEWKRFSMTMTQQKGPGKSPGRVSHGRWPAGADALTLTARFRVCFARPAREPGPDPHPGPGGPQAPSTAPNAPPPPPHGDQGAYLVAFCLPAFWLFLFVLQRRGCSRTPFREVSSLPASRW